MATHLTPAKVQQWLEKTNLTVTDINVEREIMARDMVFSRVTSRYDTTTWLDATTTPSLVLGLMSALYASYEFNAVYSHNYGETDYGRQLWSLVNQALDSISKGEIDLIDTIGGESLADFALAGFYPTDLQETDEMGEERKFTMGAMF